MMITQARSAIRGLRSGRSGQAEPADKLNEIMLVIVLVILFGDHLNVICAGRTSGEHYESIENQE